MSAPSLVEEPCPSLNCGGRPDVDVNFVPEALRLHQDLPAALHCKMEPFDHFGAVPREIMYDCRWLR